ncbi:mechanosensitive ion channel family protein [Catenovulum maritimum]|uniref:mechanosensitive ion channel family protein n=1 Tax=Catenovulum maritimum TaxID=1513271 RepID=UPI00065FE24C|nr:mechanosensitive ion channel family protein [Catenovulum maritimum]
MIFTSWVTAAVISVSFLVTAASLRAIEPGNNKRARRVAFFCLSYLLAVACFYISKSVPQIDIEASSQGIAFLMGWLTSLEIFSIILFKIILPKLGHNLPSIVTELFLGVSVVVLIGVTLSHFGVDTTSIAATSAVVTAILAIGLQATLGNVIGGVALQLDRSIRIGDWIQLENGKQGRVQEIRWRHTVLETRDWDTIIVPNSSLLAANITILGKRAGEPLQHRMWVYFSVDFRYSPSYVIDTVEKAIQAPPSILGISENPKPNCVCMDFSKEHHESYALYAVRYWLTNIQDDDPTNSLVRRRLFAALQRAKIPLAIPAAQIFVEKDNEQNRERKAHSELDKRVGALKRIEFLSALSKDEFKHLAEGLQPVLFSKGENIMVQNDQAHWLYIMTEGKVGVWVTAANQTQKVTDLSAPTFFGEMGLMTGAPRSATITAMTDVRCYRLYKDVFHKILHDRPAMAEEISAILATREVETQNVKSLLDQATQKKRIDEVSGHMLDKISDFFGLAAK